MKNVLKISTLVMLLIAFVSCKDDDDSTVQGTATMSVKLVDAPGDYDAVYIDVRDVMVKYNGSENEVSIGEINAGVYDLLELTGGVSVLLVNDEIPAGSISQIRLVLGTENTVVVDGETYDLDTPSSQQSGLKVQVNETIDDGGQYDVILDFNVEESIVAQGNGGYSLHPVIRASLAIDSGSITGLVLPLGVQTLVTASSGNTIISTYTNAQGNYVLNGVPDGTYTVTLEADASLELPPITIPDVEVIAGVATEIEVVTFQ